MVLLCATMLAAVTAELVMRCYCYSPRVFDAELGFVQDPDLASRWYREGHGTGRWQRHGVRADVPIASVGAPILVLGDSMTEAMQVNDEQTYAAQLQALRARDGVATRILNAGIAGVTIARYIALAETYQQLFHPTWTIVQFDREDLGEAWLPSDSHFVRDTPTAPLRVEAMSPSGRGGALRQLIRRWRAQSALLQNAVLQLRGLEGEWAEWVPFRADRPAQALTERPRAQLPIEEELQAIVDAFHGRVSLLFVPAPDAPDHAGETGPEERAVAEICARRSWSCPDLHGPFSDLMRDGRSPFGFSNSGFNVGHFNVDGHRTIALTLSEELKRLARDGLL